MEHIIEIVEQFADRHPVWFWLLVRLAICFCLTFVVILALLALLAAIASLEGLLVGSWLLVPVLASACWVLFSFTTYLYEEFCE